MALSPFFLEVGLAESTKVDGAYRTRVILPFPQGRGNPSLGIMRHRGCTAPSGMRTGRIGALLHWEEACPCMTARL